MNRAQLKSPQHDAIRSVLRVGGPIIAVIGLTFTIIGMVSFFSAFGSFDPPKYFWCAFVGLPTLGVGLGMCRYGYMAAGLRYILGETVPVATDAVNAAAESMRPAMKSAAKAVTEGVLEAQKEARPKS